MYFSSIQDLLLMQGHGFYVWLSYGIVFMVFVLLLVAAAISKQSVLKIIRQRKLHDASNDNDEENA